MPANHEGLRTMNEQSISSDVVALRPFVPASDFEKSLRFYTDLGFAAHRLGDSLASMELGPFAFLLQRFQAEGFAGNFMMHLLVRDVQGWWSRIESLDLVAIRRPASECTSASTLGSHRHLCCRSVRCPLARRAKSRLSSRAAGPFESSLNP